MSRFSKQDADHWRERAEEVRTVGEGLVDPECRRMMLEVASDYDKLAKRADERARNEKQS